MAKPHRHPEVRARRQTPPPSDPRARESAPPIPDTRLAWLLSLPPAELDAIYRAERRTLRALAERAARIRQDFRCGRWTAREAVQRLDEVARRTPSLLTAGVRRGRRRTFDFSVLLLTPADDERMRDAGLRVRSWIDVELPGHSGPRLRICSALADAAALGVVARSGMARAVDLARPWRPTLDTAVPEAQLDGMKESHVQITGRGVVIGVIDLGALDFYHLDFRQDAPGNPTRVKFLWDQQLERKAGEHAPASGSLMGPAAGYGVEYTEADINAELLRFKPGTTPAYEVVRHEPPPPPISSFESHGTTVTSCAAGNGLASARRYRGGAPEADIVYVRLAALDPMRVMADHGNILDAFAYIFTRAGTLGRPCVVNMSMSDLQGAHDGSSMGERFMDNLLNVPGRAITVTAGNSNGAWRHAAGTVQAGQETVIELEFGGGAKSSDAVELWYPTGDRFEASFVLPDGVTVVGPVVPNSMDEIELNNGVRISLVSQIAPMFSEANRVGVYLEVPPGAKIPLGTWQLRLRGLQVADGRFQAWIDRNNKYANFATHRVEDEGTLGVPGTSREVITVGAQVKGLPGVAAFSGRGPTRDGRDKPDLLAVGTSITAATAVHRNLSAPNAPEYRPGNNGTSYAAPLTAAACALLFECMGPSATSAQIKNELLARAAPSADGFDALLQVGPVCP